MKKITALFLALCLAFSLAACGEEKNNNFNDDVSQEDHTHAFTDITGRTFACNEGGMRILKCECGLQKTESVVPKDHTFGEWVVEKEPTDKADGVRVRICSSCNVEEVEYIPAENLDDMFKTFNGLFDSTSVFKSFSSLDDLDSEDYDWEFLKLATGEVKGYRTEDATYYKTADMDKVLMKYFGRTCDWTRQGEKGEENPIYYDSELESVVWCDGAGIGGTSCNTYYKGYTQIDQTHWRVEWSFEDDQGWGVEGDVTMTVELYNGQYRIVAYHNTYR